MLLLALGTVEAVRWQLTRQIVHLALLQAARAGATAHADPTRIRAAFQQALLPLHAGTGGAAGARRRQADAQARIAARVGAPAWRIEILRPDAQAFRDHARPGLRTDAPAGLPAIDNAYQALQYTRRPDLPDSRSIFLANTLRLRLTYLYRPLLPPLRAAGGTGRRRRQLRERSQGERPGADRHGTRHGNAQPSRGLAQRPAVSARHGGRGVPRPPLPVNGRGGADISAGL
ncbi:hypothetical protein WJ972_33060 [Achromobacter insuavis]